MSSQDIGGLLAISTVSAEDNMILQFFNIIHKPPGFKVLMYFSVNDKLCDTGNYKRKSTPTGYQQYDTENFAGIRQYMICIPYCSNKNGCHVEGIQQVHFFDDHIPDNARHNDDMEENNRLQ